MSTDYKTRLTLICNSNSIHSEEQHGEDDNNNNDNEIRDNILINEIDSWSNFEIALREENGQIFNKMLFECKENEDFIRAANSKDEFFSAESLFMVMTLQQKLINELIAKVSKQKGG
jgi:hypothetical protein